MSVVLVMCDCCNTNHNIFILCDFNDFDFYWPTPCLGCIHSKWRVHELKYITTAFRDSFPWSFWWELIYSFLASALSASYLNLAALRLSAWQILVLSAPSCRCPHTPESIHSVTISISLIHPIFFQYGVPQLAPTYSNVFASSFTTLSQNTLNLLW